MFRFPGPPQRPGGRPEREAETGRGGKGRWSAKRRTSIVLELLRGADLESTSPKHGVAAATLTECATPCWPLALRRSKSGQWPTPTSKAGGRSESSLNWPWRMSSCASASAAWRISSCSAAEVEEMSRARPPRGGHTGASRVLRAWGLRRSTFSERRRRPGPPARNRPTLSGAATTVAA